MVKRAARGRPKVKQPIEELGEEPVEKPTEEEAGGPVGNLFDNMKDDTVVVVHRFDPEAGQKVLMYRLMPDEATDVEIQRLSGGGKYITREHVRDSTGRKVFGRYRQITISGLPRMAKMPRSYEHSDSSDSPAPTKPEVGAVDTKTSIDDVLTAGILRLFTSQAEASETQAKMYQAMLARPDPVPMNWSELITALSPIIVLMLKKEDGPSTLELVTQVAAMVKENTSSTTQFKDMLETVDSVFSIKEQAAGPPADPLTTLAAQLPKILEIISSEQHSKGRMPTEEEVKRRLAVSTKKPAAGGAMPVYQALLNKFTPMMVRWARENNDPIALGNFLFGAIPKKYHGAVSEFLLREDAEELVFQTAPDLREFPEWTNECFTTLAEAFGIVEEEESEPDVTYDVGDDGVGVEVVETTKEVVEETIEEGGKD